MLRQMGRAVVKRSGVWLESVSRWGRNQRASPEAGDAGHPGPTAPGPVGQEHRVLRDSATTPNQSLEGNTALEKENAIAYATSAPAAQTLPLSGRCSA
ncbi:hypothetical protein LEMLEM_LOCUS6718, partial [Lemmus lemmus]